MGIQDRDYYKEKHRKNNKKEPRKTNWLKISLITNIILISWIVSHYAKHFI
jgi:hypothetical protein